MSATDRTLLAILGFQDPDRKDPMHDWACQYLAQPEVLGRLVAPLTVYDGSIHLEYHITKGWGQYKQTIGFIDLLASVDSQHLILEVKISPTCWRRHQAASCLPRVSSGFRSLRSHHLPRDRLQARRDGRGDPCSRGDQTCGAGSRVPRVRQASSCQDRHEERRDLVHRTYITGQLSS
jgi:hypothetical protein